RSASSRSRRAVARVLCPPTPALASRAGGRGRILAYASGLFSFPPRSAGEGVGAARSAARADERGVVEPSRPSNFPHRECVTTPLSSPPRLRARAPPPPGHA